MWILFIGDTLNVLGIITIAMTLLALTSKSDNKNLNRNKNFYVYVGITMIIVGFVLNQLGNYLV